MNRLRNQSFKKRYLFSWLCKSDLAYISVRSILPIAILGIILIVVFFFFTNSENQTSELVQQNILAESGESTKNADISDKYDFIPESQNSVISYENIDSREKIEEEISNLESTKWSWIDPYNKQEITWTAEQAFEEATKYAEGDKPRQLEALKMYQRVLDANPTRLMELNTKLTMGARMMILYNPEFGEGDMYDEGLKWYEQLVHDFNDLGNHTDMMTAKVCLGDLYCWKEHGIAEAKKASDLCLQIINIPEKDIILDNKYEIRYNLENIKNAQLPGGRSLRPPPEKIIQDYRRGLLERRQEVIDRFRLVAIRSLITKQYISGFPREVYLERLKLLKQERPDDQLYQETLNARIQEVSRSVEDYHSEVDKVLEEGLNSDNTP